LINKYNLINTTIKADLIDLDYSNLINLNDESVYNNSYGIYMIINLINKKIYIGSTGRNFKIRECEHFSELKRGIHYSKHLQRSYNIHGKDNFKFIIIEIIEDTSILLEREQYYIDFYKSYKSSNGYNILPVAGSRLGFKAGKMSDATKIKLRLAQQGKYCGKNNPMYGVHLTHSEDAKRKISDSHKGKKFTKEHKKKLSDAQLKSVINIDTGEIFDSLTNAAISYNVGISSISYACSGTYKTASGYHWAYYKDYLKLSQDKINEIINYKSKLPSNTRQVINLEDNIIFPSITEAAKYYHVSNSIIGAICRGKRKTLHNKYHFMYYDNYLLKDTPRS